jgi:hypothetical protein
MLFDHAYNELIDLLGDPRSATLFSRLAAVELLGNQSLVPSHEGVGCREGGELFASRAAQWRGSGRKASALGVGEVQSSRTELGFEDAMFLLEIGDDLLLMPSDPAGEHGDQDMQDHGLSSG